MHSRALKKNVTVMQFCWDFLKVAQTAKLSDLGKVSLEGLTPGMKAKAVPAWLYTFLSSSTQTTALATWVERRCDFHTPEMGSSVDCVCPGVDPRQIPIPSFPELLAPPVLQRSHSSEP